jgi:hypothetical protein
VGKRILLIGIGLAALVAAFPVYHLGIALSLWQPLIRPRGVSASAHYVSIVEEGTWFDCHLDFKRNVDVCKAWDPDGRLIVDGDFLLEGENRPASESELRPTHVARGDGQVWRIDLHGKDGNFSKALVPVSVNRAHPDQ